MIEPINYRIWEDLDLRYQFFIPSSQVRLTDNDIENLISSIISFHEDYVRISQKYEIAEVLSKDFIEKNPGSMEAYISSLEEDMMLNTVRFFPLTSILPEKKFLFPSKLIMPGLKEEMYVYGIGGVDNSPLYFHDLNTIKLNRLELDRVVDVTTSSYLTYELDPYLEYSIGFDIRIKSNLFCPYIQDEKSDKTIDNRSFAYINGNRFNNFLSDLKDVWINKYNWNFKFDGTVSSALEVCLNEAGVALSKPFV